MSFLSRFNVIPQFPAYKGPYTVASFELEIPIASLSASQKPPNSAGSITTVQFRVFYPTAQRFEPTPPPPPEGAPTANTEATEKPAAGWGSGWFRNCRLATAPEPSRPVYWLPEPHQREYLSGYARFMGAGSGLAELISYIPRILHHIATPAISLAPLIPSVPEFKFPTVIFSHGLGGTRMAYSHICGSLASYGMVVIAPEHRDGSAPVTFIKSGSQGETELAGTEPGSNEPGIDAASAAAIGGSNRVRVDHASYPHQISETTANGRNRQFEIRLWELSMIYEAIAQLDLGKVPAGTAMFDADAGTRDSLLSAFTDKLDIRAPGRLVWAGHSFGSATMIQMVKTVYYSGKMVPAEEGKEPLFVPDPSVPHHTPSGAVPLREQITASSPLLLLDIWCLPLLSERTRPLWKLPLPQVGGGNPEKVLTVLSEEFFIWRENMRGVRRVLSMEPGLRRGGEGGGDKNKAFGQPSPHPASPAAAEGGVPSPKKSVGLYYIKGSAHLSQSDFGVLFPRAIKKAVDAEMILDLNVRATCQWLRQRVFGAQMAGYTPTTASTDAKLEKAVIRGNAGGEDGEIFAEGGVARWVQIPLEEE